MSAATAPKWVVMYRSADNVAGRAPAHFPGHRERLRQFHDRGELLLVGTFADAQADGSMSVFRTRAAAEEFVSGDPFVLHGVVSDYRVLEWKEIYGA